ncbi:lipopolysaccharide biosynthesis protein [Candidatus Fermentibacteria bacterium]|nr:lipopolysaccharide biosynthesis protein [Candidatus Fermentibacteria bacterium]
MTALKRETVLYAAATTVGGLAMLAFLPFMSASLSAEEAGAVGSLRTLADVVAGIAVLGFPTGMMRYWQDGATSRRHLLRLAVILPFAAAAVLGGLLLLFRDAVCNLLRLETPSLLLHGFLLGAGAAMVQVLASPLRAEGRAGSYLAVQSVRTAASVVLLVILLGRGGPGVTPFLASRWAPALVASLALLVMAVPLAKREGKPPSGLLRFSLPFVPSGLALLVLQSADMTMLRSIGGDLGQSGYYEWATSACMILAPLTQGFGMAWLRHIFRDRESRNDPGRMGRSALQFVVLALLAAAILSLAAPELASALGGEAFAPAGRVIPLLAGANALYALFVVAQTGPLLSGRTDWIALVTILGAGANILFNARLIPLYGAQGAALATLGTNVFMAGSLFWTGRRAFPVSFPVISVLMLLAALLGPVSQLPLGFRAGIAAAGTAAALSLVSALRRAG